MKRFFISLLTALYLSLGVFAQPSAPLPAHQIGSQQREKAVEVVHFLDSMAAQPDFDPREYDRFAAEFATHFINFNTLIGASVILHRAINTMFDPTSELGFKAPPYNLSATIADFYMRGGDRKNSAEWCELTLRLCEQAGPECIGPWMRNVFTLCSLSYLDGDKEGALRMFNQEVDRVMEIEGIKSGSLSPDVFNALFFCGLLLSKDYSADEMLPAMRLLMESDISSIPTVNAPFIQMFLCRQMVTMGSDWKKILDFYKELRQWNPYLVWHYAVSEILFVARQVSKEEYISLLPEAYYYLCGAIGANMNAFSVYDTEDYWDKKAAQLNWDFGFGLNLNPGDYVALTAARQNAIFTKNLSLQSYHDTWDFIRDEGPREFQELLDDVIDLRRQIGRETDSIKREELFLESNHKEWSLRVCVDFQNNLTHHNNLAVTTYHTLIPDEECHVEIIDYVHRDEKTIGRSRHYGAVICKAVPKWNDFLQTMTNIDKYEFVDLGAVSVWERLYIGSRPKTDRQRATHYSPEEEKSVARLMAPLVEKIKGFKRAYVSSTGVLNSVNLGALPYRGETSGNTPTHTINDVVEIVRVMNTAELRKIKEQGTSLYRAVVFSNIDYNNDTPKSGDVACTELSLHRLPIEKGGNVKRFSALPIDGGELEKAVKGCAKLVRHLSGAEATEHVFKDLDWKAPDLIHIDSHGFYIPEGDNAFLGKHSIEGTRERNLLTCGLPFAGANKAWSGEETPVGEEDGILTAWEISCMDLRGCKLAVLSACETASGDNDPINGVLGLQRALKIAGVQSMLLTLWPVDNELTQEFINGFYRRIPESSSFNEAFVKTQREFRLRHPDPYIWAPFLLLN